MLTSVKLTDEELSLLDGQCSWEVQKEVNAARKRCAFQAANPGVNPAIAGFIADTVSLGLREGKLIYRHTPLAHCALCDKRATYAKYKSGQRKGIDNYNKRLWLHGVNFGDSFVVMTGYPKQGACQECIDALLPLLKESLKGLPIELAKELQTEGAPRFKRYANRRCTKCEWTGHDGQMRQLRAVFEGTYPGGCPSCPAENRAFGPDLIQGADGYKVIEVADAKEGA